MSKAVDILIGIIGGLGCVGLVALASFEMGREAARMSFQCPPGTVYSVVYPDGSVKCQMPSIQEPPSRKEMVWQESLRKRMGMVK